MNQEWRITIHRLVIEEDLKNLAGADQSIILKAIRKKLSVDPQAYGKPLTGAYKGYWRLRVQDYRVIYRIKAAAIEVVVVKVGIRRDDEVYRRFAARLEKLTGSP